MFVVRQPHHFAASPFAAAPSYRGFRRRNCGSRRRGGPISFADLLHQTMEPQVASQVRHRRRSSAEAIRVDISETDQAIVVEADVPGFAKDEVTVDLDRRVLTITAQRKTEEDTEKHSDDAADDQDEQAADAADWEKLPAADGHVTGDEVDDTDDATAKETKVVDSETSEDVGPTVTHHLRERRSPRFVARASRSFRLPSAVDAEQAEASFADGVLRIVLPKAQTQHHISLK